MNEFVTIIIVFIFAMIGLFSGISIGKNKIYQEYLKTKEVCWQTHPVYVGDEENPIKFKCYEVTNLHKEI